MATIIQHIRYIVAMTACNKLLRTTDVSFLDFPVAISRIFYIPSLITIESKILTKGLKYEIQIFFKCVQKSNVNEL